MKSEVFKRDVKNLNKIIEENNANQWNKRKPQLNRVYKAIMSNFNSKYLILHSFYVWQGKER